MSHVPDVDWSRRWDPGEEKKEPSGEHSACFHGLVTRRERSGERNVTAGGYSAYIVVFGRPAATYMYFGG